MNIQKFTQKSIEALQNAQTLASTNQNVQVEQEHILLALLEQDNSLIKELIKKITSNEENFENEVKRLVDNKPRMTGGSRPNDGIYVSQDTDLVLADSENIAKKMKDEYVSVEHIMISIFDHANSQLKELFRTFNITKNAFLKTGARRSARSTTPSTTGSSSCSNPEPPKSFPATSRRSIGRSTGSKEPSHENQRHRAHRRIPLRGIQRRHRRQGRARGAFHRHQGRGRPRRRHRPHGRHRCPPRRGYRGKRHVCRCVQPERERRAFRLPLDRGIGPAHHAHRPDQHAQPRHRARRHDRLLRPPPEDRRLLVLDASGRGRNVGRLAFRHQRDARAARAFVRRARFGGVRPGGGRLRRRRHRHDPP